jgi:hypothetical protein
MAMPDPTKSLWNGIDRNGIALARPSISQAFCRPRDGSSADVDGRPQNNAIHRERILHPQLYNPQ